MGCVYETGKTRDDENNCGLLQCRAAARDGAGSVTGRDGGESCGAGGGEGPASTTAVLLEEDQEIREENVKYFFRSDGNREAAVYQEPVHYQEDGTWKDIDNTLVEVETEDGKTAFRNKENDLKVTLPQTLASSEEVAVSYQDHRLSFRLKGDTPAAKARSRTAGTATLHQPSPCRLEELQAAYQNRKAETAGTEMAARPRLLHAEAPDIVSLSDSELADALNEEMRSLRKLNAGVTYSGGRAGAPGVLSPARPEAQGKLGFRSAAGSGVLLICYRQRRADRHSAGKRGGGVPGWGRRASSPSSLPICGMRRKARATPLKCAWPRIRKAAIRIP